MIAIAAALLAPAVIEMSGVMTLVASLVPIVLLIVLIVYMRTRKPRNNSTAKQRNVEPLGVVATAAGTMVDEKPAESEPQPATIDWAARIKEAEEADNRSLLPGLYLSLARAEIADGRNEFALEHLRSSVMTAIKTRDGATQAEARLELAELARAAGDLTTACEHWQIARGLFHKMSEQAKLGDTERLMQQHGCPTDWVLNDF